MASRSKILPYAALVAGILALSLSSLFVRWAKAPGPVTSFYRMGIAALVLAPFFFRRPRNTLPADWRLFLLPVLGGFITSLDHSTWSTAIGYTSVANATLLNNTAPLWVALVAWLIFKERLKKFFWVGLALTMGGAVIVLGSDFLLQPALNLGNFLALISGLFYAGYFLVTQRGRQFFDTLPYVWIVSLSAALSLLGITQVFGMPLAGYTSQTYLAFLGAGLISQVVGYFSVGYALGHLPASLVAPTMITQPVITALMAIPLVGEGLRPGQWVGGLIVLGGIYLVNKSRETQPAPSPVDEGAVPITPL